MTYISKIRMIAILAAAIPLLSQGNNEVTYLEPTSIKQIGEFCYTGIVTATWVLEESNGRRHHIYMSPRLGVCTGDVIAVKGNFIQRENGSVQKSAYHVKHLGKSPVPPPMKAPLAELLRQDSLCRRVITEGSLVLLRKDEIDSSATQLIVKDGTTVLNAAVYGRTKNTIDLTSLLGARLRLTGILIPSTGARMNALKYLAIENNGIEVVKPPPVDIFDAPVLNLNSGWTPNEIVRMEARRFEGVVLATWGGDQMMLEGKDFHRIKATLARPEELPTAGEHVAVVGFTDTDLYAINLIYARCKPLPKKAAIGTEPKPVNVALRKLLTDARGRPGINGYSHGRLLRIKGTILDVQPSLLLFSLNDDGFTLPVDCSSSPDVIPRLEPGSMIEIVVLAVTETESWRESIALPQTRGLRLILRSKSDLKVLARPPWWTPARLTAAVISLLVIIVLIIAANRALNRIMMRRKVAERTRLAVELHDSLSQTLAGVACQIAAGENAISEDPETARNLLATAERMLESSRTELKNCLFDLRNDTVDDPDFERAILRTLTGLKPEADISVRFQVARSLMTDTMTHAVLCIIRELVANAIRHGAATNIKVVGTADDGCLRFSVSDNGCGFDPQRHPGPRDGHFGLSGIRERIAAMNGSFTITSSPGSTRATVDITLP